MRTVLLSPWTTLAALMGCIAASLLAAFTPVLPAPDTPILHTVTLVLLCALVVPHLFTHRIVIVQGTIMLMGLTGHLVALAVPGVNDQLGLLVAAIALAVFSVDPASIGSNIRAHLWGTIDRDELVAWLLRTQTPLARHFATLTNSTMDCLTFAIKPTTPWGTVMVFHNTDPAGFAMLEKAIVDHIGARVYTGPPYLGIDIPTPSAHSKLAMAAFKPRVPFAQEVRRTFEDGAIIATVWIATLLIAGVFFATAKIAAGHEHNAWLRTAFAEALHEAPIVLSPEQTTWLNNTAQGGKAYPIPGIKGQHFLVCVDTPNGVYSYATHHRADSKSMHLTVGNTTEFAFKERVCRTP